MYSLFCRSHSHFVVNFHFFQFSSSVVLSNDDGWAHVFYKLLIPAEAGLKKKHRADRMVEKIRNCVSYILQNLLDDDIELFKEDKILYLYTY